MSNTTKHYAKRDHEAQGIHYPNHVSSMTTEGLHTERYFTVVYKLTDVNVAKYLSNRDWVTFVYADSMAELASLKELSAEPAAPAQAATPDMTDAYAGAREDLSIWKKRALEAEALNRKFAASINSPSFMGEPAAQGEAND